MNLLPFQIRFIKRALARRTAALSLARGNGKSWLAAHLCSRILDPSDTLFRPGTESYLVAASVGQARRTVFALLRGMLDPDAYKLNDSAANLVAATHRSTGTRIQVLAANPKAAQGLTQCPYVIADEPGAWQTVGGEAMFDAIQTAQGKPGSDMRALFFGTLAPATGGWWHDLIGGGSTGSTYVQALQGNPKRWDDWREVLRVNPLMRRFENSRDVLREELKDAQKDARLKARFLSFRLNAPSESEESMLLSVEDWERCLGREVPERDGRPVVGIDLGGNRAWSAAVAVWPNGRVEAVAVAPGIPEIEEQEKRDRVPAGTYRALVQSGALRVAENRRIPPASMLAEWFLPLNPAAIACDRFRVNELRDCGIRCEVVSRSMRWSEASEDIRGFRKLAFDGPLSIAPDARALLSFSLAASLIEADTSGNVRLKKKKADNSARDDCAAALVLAAGAVARMPGRKEPKWALVG